MSKQTFGERLGKLILRKRKSMGLTQTQLAEDAYGTAGNTRTISELENGTVANPHPKTIDPIINVLKISNAELEDCATETHSVPDADLDRAYREARNLIDAIAKQFEHSNPAATLSELDEFLRIKAKEWASLRERIASLEADDESIKALTEAASEALAAGRLDEVETLLSRVEDSYQHDRTLKELRKLAELRIARADLALLRRDFKNATRLYLSAAELFSSIDESELVALLDFTGARVYQAGRQSTEPYFKIAVPLLERLISTSLVQKSRVKLAEVQYQLSLVLRNAVAREKTPDRPFLLMKAIGYCRTALGFEEIVNDVGRRSMILVSLCNCISDLYDIKKDTSLLEEGATALNQTLADLIHRNEPRTSFSYLYNSLGLLLMKKLDNKNGNDREELVELSIDAFRKSIWNSEKEALMYSWATAKLNIGTLFMERSLILKNDAEKANFNRILAISEFQASLDSFTILNLPVEFAQAHENLGRALVEQATCDLENGNIEFYLARAIASYEIAKNTFTEDKFPHKWASITVQMARVLGIHSQIEGVESAKYDLEQSSLYFQTSLNFYRTNGSLEMAEYCSESLGKIEKRLKQFRQ
jgi:transcriptional regulator with XRE-family HTH domain